MEAGEVELMERYCQGDARAFDALYARVAPRLLGYLVGLVNERATAEDLLQQTFLKLHTNRDVYVRGADPVPWMYTIAHRTFLDEARRKKRARVRLASEGETLPELRADLDGAAEGQGPELEPDQALAPETLAALQQLPQAQREAIMLTKVHGRSHAEAAVITGTTPGAIKLRAHRAYESLRKLLGARRQP